jgi:hypothetical protein
MLTKMFSLPIIETLGLNCKSYNTADVGQGFRVRRNKNYKAIEKFDNFLKSIFKNAMSSLSANDVPVQYSISNMYTV